MNIWIIVAVFCITLAGVVFSRRSKLVPAKSNSTPFLSLLEATSIVARLTELGYFKYAAPADVDKLKHALCASIAEFGILSTEYFGDTSIPKDYRLYFLDGEELFEAGGFKSALDQLHDLFSKMNLKFDITNHMEEWDDDLSALNHELTVNGKRYVIFKNMKDGYAWGEAALYFAQMINDQLGLQHMDERMYLINGGNDGSAVFLTNQQLEVVNTLCKDRKWMPLSTEDWRVEMQVASV